MLLMQVGMILLCFVGDPHPLLVVPILVDELEKLRGPKGRLSDMEEPGNSWFFGQEVNANRQ